MNRTTRAQRINARYDTIWETYENLHRGEKMISIDQLLASRNQYTFCTVPKWAKFAWVDAKNHVLSYHRTNKGVASV